MEDREQVARQLAKKDKREWDKLGEMLQNAYRHNADEDIKCRAAVPVAEGGTAVHVTCSRCGDQAYIKGNPCLECNPVGLPADKVHPGAVLVDEKREPATTGTTVGIGNVNLCDSCGGTYPVCDSPNVEYSEDPARADKVVKCVIYTPIGMLGKTSEETAAAFTTAGIAADEKSAEQKRATRELWLNEYRCSKCSKPGKTIIHILQKSGKGVGHKHLEFKAV